MGLLFRLETEDGLKLAIRECSADDADHLVATDRSEYDQLHHARRRNEWLAARRTLRNDLGYTGPVRALENGKPLVEGMHVSFSHCMPLAGALLHPHQAGFDIQVPAEKILRVKAKFASKEELAMAVASGDELQWLTILWAVKEALFKVYGEQLPFADGIRVHGFEVRPGDVHADVLRMGTTVGHTIKIFRVLNAWVAVVIR